jgi:hypothetical protein
MNYTKHLDFAERIAGALDSQFGWGPWRFGLDPVLGFIPVIGDLVPLLLSMYILWIGRKLEVPHTLQRRMLAFAVADVAIGMIPVAGDISDFFWRANTRNIRLLRKYLAEQPIEGKIIAGQPQLAAV